MSRAIAAATMAIAVAACGQDGREPVSVETRAREAFVRRVAADEGLLAVWSLMSRADLVFDDVAAPLAMAAPLLAPPSAPPSVPVRWLGPRTLLRVRGRGDHRLAIRGHVDLVTLHTRPRVSVSFDGAEVDSQVVADDGGFDLAATIAGARLRGWSSVYLTLSTVSQPWQAPADLAVARLEHVTWEPSTPAAAADPAR